MSDRSVLVEASLWFASAPSEFVMLAPEFSVRCKSADGAWSHRASVLLEGDASTLICPGHCGGSGLMVLPCPQTNEVGAGVYFDGG